MKDERVMQACWLVLTTRARPTVRSEVGLPRLAHIAKGAMYAPPDREAKGGVRRRKSKFAKRTWNVPWNQQFHFLESHFSIADWERGWVAHTWRCLPCVRPEIVAEAGRCEPTL